MPFEIQTVFAAVSYDKKTQKYISVFFINPNDNRSGS